MRLLIQFNQCWTFCRAAERGLTDSIQTRKSGARFAAQITATAACKWLTPPTFTWSRSQMTRWAHMEEHLHTHGRTRAQKSQGMHFKDRFFLSQIMTFLYVPVWQSDWQHMGGERKTRLLCLDMKTRPQENNLLTKHTLSFRQALSLSVSLQLFSEKEN